MPRSVLVSNTEPRLAASAKGAAPAITFAPRLGRVHVPLARHRGSGKRGRWDIVLVAVVLLACWQLAASTVLSDSHTLIGPIEVGQALVADRALLLTNTMATARIAVVGFLLGNLTAFALAVFFVLSPTIEKIFGQFAVALYALPTLVLAPILTFLLGPENTKVVVAALVAFFPTLVAVTSGLRAAPRDTVDLVRSLGGSRWTALVKVRLRWSLPHFCDGLRVAVPGALLGAIASEWLGADIGLGVFMVNALGYLNTARVWASCVVCVVLTLVGYTAVGLFNNVVNRWYVDSAGIGS